MGRSFVRRGALQATVAALAILAAEALSHAQYPPPVLERPLSVAVPGDLAEGKRLYNAQCALCHGIDGGGGYGPSLLVPAFARASDDDGLFRIVRVGIPGVMPGFGDANGPERSWQLAAFVRSLTRSSGGTVTGNPQHGRAVYEERGCATCHVLAGQGRAFGPDLSSIGQQRGPAYLKQALVEPASRVPDGHVVVTATPKSGPAVRGVRVSEDAFWVHVRDVKGQLHAFRVADLRELKREAGASLMPAYATLPAADLDDLVAYLSSLRGQR
ncbi:MAG: c-type cytochrome [Acidobacteria bacterium]|nr:c-type cytochrome [Acidobacteriota bacterium]